MHEKLLSKKEFKELLRLDGDPGNCFKQKGYKIYPLVRYQREFLCVYDFGEKIWAENVTIKRHRLYLNDYVITIGSPSNKQQDQVDWSTVNIYNVKTGEINHVLCGLNCGICDLESIVVVERRLIIINKENFLHFYIVIDGFLTEIPVINAEQIIRNFFLPRNEVASLLKRYSDQWENQNGILINPVTKDIPSMLHVGLKRKKYQKVPVPHVSYAQMVVIAMNGTAKKEIRYIDKKSIVF